MLPALLLSFLFSLCMAQPVTSINMGMRNIQGVIIDSIGHDPLSNVTVIVQEARTNQFVKGTSSKENGSFKIKGLPVKEYQLVLSCVGYKTKTIQVHVVIDAITDFSNIELAHSPIQLKQIEVFAKKQLIEQNLEKLIYHVEDDPENQILPVLDLLRKVPMLTIDADDNLQMNGNGNFKVLVNGQRSSLFVNNPSEVFKAMKGDVIKAIEVITSPSPRYDTEGAAGIINIITYKKNITGYNGLLTMELINPYALNFSSMIMAQTKKFGFSGQLANNVQANPAGRLLFLREDKNYGNTIVQRGEGNNNQSFRYMNGEVSYDFSAADQLAVNYNINASSGSNNSRQLAKLFDSYEVLTNVYERLINNSNTGNAFDVGLNYQHRFKKSNRQLLTLSYKLNNNINYNNTDLSLLSLLDGQKQVSTTNNKDKQLEHSIQMDYSHPIGKQTLELGIKSNLRFSNSAYCYTNLDTATNNFVPDLSLSNNFNYRLYIHAAYTSLQLKKGNWGIRTGARMEATSIDANFNSSGTIVAWHYFNFIPVINLMHRLKGTTTIQISYTQRLDRPGLYYLNPYVDVTDSRNISFGNPSLKPATSHMLNFTGNLLIKQSWLSISFWHYFTSNSIQRYTTLGADSVARTSFGNIGRSKVTGLSLISNTTLFKVLSININSSASYMQFSGTIKENQQNNKGFTFNLFGSTSYRINNKWRLNADIGYTSADLSAQARTAGYCKNNISIYYQFLKNNKATVSVLANNLFQRYRHTLYEINNESFHLLQESYAISRRISISFNYRFGKVQGAGSVKSKKT